jgi:N-acetyl-gamma-glutamyl-phosphate reductase
MKPDPTQTRPRFALSPAGSSKWESNQGFAVGSPRVLVAGATGFAGALAAHLLWRHPSFELAALTGRSELGRRLDDIYPRYRVPLKIQALDMGHRAQEADGEGVEMRNSADLDGIDAAIVGYPHAAAAPTVAALLDRGLRVIDLSADFRLKDRSTYERWYGTHPTPQLLGDATYGLTELHRSSIREAQLVANPGCYPTASLLALAPLARAGLIADVVIDAKQGVSGAGRNAPVESAHLSYTGENIFPYKVAGHRHTPEIEEQLALLGARLPVQFQAHLVSLDQGELASCYVTPTHAVTPTELADCLDGAYRDEPFVEVSATPSGVREVRETNFCRLHAAVDPHTGKLLVFAAIDNLWKGTSSQAIQNLNLMFGKPETEGLL